MMEILNICTYANNKDGQIFHFTKYEKDFIAQKLNTTENYLKQQIIKLQKGGIVKRISHGVYAVNPFLFGKGEWKDIKKAQMTFDFAKKRIEVEFEHMEEGAENE
jgi:butyrate kinase